ncbi:MAG: ABC transporter substrate-binding protein [Planctomycetes bacterium]|nr:ABC transporter substrate-binding protein [Planctomycetota bacterium]
MARIIGTSGIIALSIILLALSLLIACDGGSGDDPTAQLTEGNGTEDVVITIGNHSDLTGPTSNAMDSINKALDDLIEYFNDENFIPGVELKVVTYDGQMDPARDIPGYEWLREKGADLIFAVLPPTVVTLSPVVEKDEVVLFAAAADKKQLDPPGYTFSLGTIPQYEASTMLKWISDNDWDYKTNGPAKIGGASWEDGYSDSFFDTVEEYAEVHPYQFEWTGGHLAPTGTFTWGPEVEALKNCDYVFSANPMITFVRELRNVGSTAKLIGTDIHAAFLGMISDADLWGEIDGMLFLRSSLWWNDEGTMIDLTKELLYKNHPDEAESIIRSGNGYTSVVTFIEMLNIIRDAVETVGAENFSSEALYEAAKSFSLTIDGVDRYSFDETKRTAINYYVMSEARGEEETIFKISDWIPNAGLTQ